MCAYVYAHGSAFVCVYLKVLSLYFLSCFLNKSKHSSAKKLDTEHDIVAAFIGRERVIQRKRREHIQNPPLLGEGISTLGNPTRA